MNKKCQKSKKIITVVYGKEKQWDSFKEAKDFFFECFILSEGSEKNRYMLILEQLNQNKLFCTDELNNN